MALGGDHQTKGTPAPATRGHLADGEEDPMVVCQRLREVVGGFEVNPYTPNRRSG